MTWQQFLTEKVLKKCWHDVDTSVDVYFCKKCGMSRAEIFMGGNCATDHRTFDNRDDMMDLYEQIEKDWKWEDFFWDFAFQRKPPDYGYGSLETTTWLFCLDGNGYEQRCKMVAEFYGWEGE